MDANNSSTLLIVLRVSAWIVWAYFLVIELSTILVTFVKDESSRFPALPGIILKNYCVFSVMFLIIELFIAYFLRHYMIIRPLEHSKIDKYSAGGFLVVFIVSLVNWFVAYSISLSGAVIYSLYNNMVVTFVFVAIGFIVMIINVPVIFDERYVVIKKVINFFK